MCDGIDEEPFFKHGDGLVMRSSRTSQVWFGPCCWERLPVPCTQISVQQCTANIHPHTHTHTDTHMVGIHLLPNADERRTGTYIMHVWSTMSSTIPKMIHLSQDINQSIHRIKIISQIDYQNCFCLFSRRGEAVSATASERDRNGTRSVGYICCHSHSEEGGCLAFDTH